jgi:hypothetical protein
MRQRIDCALSRLGMACCALVCAAALGGCGSSTPPAPPAPPERQATVFDPLLQQVDRAKQQAVEMEQRKQRLDSALDAQEH